MMKSSPKSCGNGVKRNWKHFRVEIFPWRFFLQSNFFIEMGSEYKRGTKSSEEWFFWDLLIWIECFFYLRQGFSWNNRMTGEGTFSMYPSSRIARSPVCDKAFTTRNVQRWASIVLAASVNPMVWFPPFSGVGMAVCISWRVTWRFGYSHQMQDVKKGVLHKIIGEGKDPWTN